LPDVPVVKYSTKLKPRRTRRPGVRERRLLSAGECGLLNIILVDLQRGAEVELHPYPTSETFFILKGAVEMILDGAVRKLKKGDMCYLPKNVSHGLRCLRGPAQILVIFAPPVANVRKK
jgi:quercetin dioxygenase-like cupin family protein